MYKTQTMKSFLVCLLGFHFQIYSTNSEICFDSWPSNLKSVKECCETPLSTNMNKSNIESVCSMECAAKGISRSNKSEIPVIRKCLEDCFVNFTGLLDSEMKINKSAVREILFDDIMLAFVPEWSHLVDEAIEVCEFKSSENLSNEIMSYQHCMREFLVKNCVYFNENVDGCDKVEEYFYENCKSYESNCTVWPSHLSAMEDCCKFPQVIRDELAFGCDDKCKDLEFFEEFEHNCVFECINNETNLMDKSDQKFNFKVLKQLLVENSNKSKEWEKPISDAIELCEKEMTKPINNSAAEVELLDEQFNILEICLYSELSFRCPPSAFENIHSCLKAKRYNEKCPTTRHE